MKFRHHRGGLAESLKTAVEIKNKQELYEILSKEISQFGFNFAINDIECKYQGYDDRIDWDTYLITIKNYGPVGMANAQI